MKIICVINSVTLRWRTNKTPTALVLNNKGIEATSTTRTYDNLALTTNTTWQLQVADERGWVVSGNTSIKFVNGVYFGATSEPSIYNSNFILSLTKQLSEGKISSFSVTSGVGQYIYYCLPVSMGTCSFNVGGFDGGFTLVDTISFTNQYNYTEDYYIYRSDNTNLGAKTIKVS